MSMRRKVCFLVSLMIILTSLLPGASFGEKAGVFESPEEAERFVSDMLTGKGGAWEDRVRLSSMMVLAILPYGGLQGLGETLTLQLGQAGTVGPAYMAEGENSILYRVPCTFAAQPLDIGISVQDGEITGIVTLPFTGSLKGSSEEKDGYRSIALELPVPELNGALPGTLTVPDGEGPFPAVVLVHGSGPSNRDETTGQLSPFRDIAEGLAAKGIAVYRYDKRTYVYGAQMAADHSITLMDETIDDAVQAVRLLAGQEGIDPGRIYVAGHSLGAMALPAVDRELENEAVKACGYIFLAPGARPLDVTMREQYDYLYSLMPEVPQEALAEKEALFRDLDRLNDPASLTDDDVIAGAYAPYWRWLNDYTQSMMAMAGEIAEPCLLMQGEEDYQVTMTDFALWKDAVCGKSSWTLISYPGLTHAFVHGQKTEGAAVYARSQKVDQQVIDDLAAFILDQDASVRNDGTR